MREGSSHARTRITEKGRWTRQGRALPLIIAAGSRRKRRETNDVQKSMVRFGVNAWSLGTDTSSVIALRTLKIAAGGAAAEVEACRMVSEKIETVLALQALALTGGLGLTASSVATKMLTHYRRKVHANRRRLAKR
jgi:hypothetical protein